ncbi:MAG: O-antigen ligase family protein [Candidatus Hydrogenedentes bacterium]|nr:O-antigen ligase family protein [Candidatus Hydrogenedentota bacterium]
MSAYSHAAAPALGLWKGLGYLLLAIAFGIAVILLGKLAIVGVVGLVFFILFIYFPVLGLYATTALLLLSGSQGIVGVVEGGALAVTLARLCGTAALGAWLVNLLIRKIRFEFNWPVIWLSAFCAWALLCTLVSPERAQVVPEWIRLVTLLGFFFLAVNTLNSTRNLHYFLVLIMVCGLLMSLAAVSQYFVPQLAVAGAEPWRAVTEDVAYIDQESLSGAPALRVSGRAGHSNWLALVILLILPLNSYWYAIAKSNKLKALILFTVAIEVVTLVLTFTRTGLIIGVVLAFLLLLKRLVRVTSLRIFAVLGLIVFGWIVLPQPYKERVFSPQQYTRSTSVQSRLDMQEAALRYFAQNPLFGYGSGGFGTQFIHERNQSAALMRMYVKYAGWQPVFIGTHNMYLQLLADTGFVGFCLFMAFLTLLLRQLYLKEKRCIAEGDAQGAAMASALFVSLVAFVLCAVFLHGLSQKIWWMIAAAAVVLCLYNMSFKEGLLPKWGWSTEAHRGR